MGDHWHSVLQLGASQRQTACRRGISEIEQAWISLLEAPEEGDSLVVLTASAAQLQYRRRVRKAITLALEGLGHPESFNTAHPMSVAMHTLIAQAKMWVPPPHPAHLQEHALMRTLGDNLDPITLRQLAAHPSPRIRAAVAGRDSALQCLDPGLYLVLAGDPVPAVRHEAISTACMNPDLLEPLLFMGLHDIYVPIREQIARSPWLGASWLEPLCYDTVPAVRAWASYNLAMISKPQELGVEADMGNAQHLVDQVAMAAWGGLLVPTQRYALLREDIHHQLMPPAVVSPIFLSSVLDPWASDTHFTDPEIIAQRHQIWPVPDVPTTKGVSTYDSFHQQS